MGMARSMHGREGKYITGFGEEPKGKNKPLMTWAWVR